MSILVSNKLRQVFDIFSQIHSIIAQALYSGSKEVKTLILEMAGLPSFPKNNIAGAMTSMQNLVSLTSPLPTKSNYIMNEISTPVLSITQVEKLDNLMTKLKVCRKHI